MSTKTTPTWLKWLNRLAILALLMGFRAAVRESSISMQIVFAALVVGNAWYYQGDREP